MSDDLAIWPRIKAAIYSTVVSREAAEFDWPACHKAKCKQSHGTTDEAFWAFTEAVADSVFKELACRAVTEPDEQPL